MKFGYSGPTPKPVISSAAIVRTLLPETSSVVCDTPRMPIEIKIICHGVSFFAATPERKRPSAMPR